MKSISAPRFQIGLAKAGSGIGSIGLGPNEASASSRVAKLAPSAPCQRVVPFAAETSRGTRTVIASPPKLPRYHRYNRATTDLRNRLET
jgi:hypothetical protein